MTDLSEDATLRDLVSPPKERQEFVRRALSVLSTYRREHGPVVLRVGRTGTGRAPNYRIETEDGEAVVALNGANHDLWTEGERFDGSKTWSNVSMSYAEVESLLGELRGHARR